MSKELNAIVKKLSEKSEKQLGIIRNNIKMRELAAQYNKKVKLETPTGVCHPDNCSNVIDVDIVDPPYDKSIEIEG